jgi:hypothetical protein
MLPGNNLDKVENLAIAIAMMMTGQNINWCIPKLPISGPWQLDDTHWQSEHTKEVEKNPLPTISSTTILPPVASAGMQFFRMRTHWVSDQSCLQGQALRRCEGAADDQHF